MHKASVPQLNLSRKPIQGSSLKKAGEQSTRRLLAGLPHRCKSHELSYRVFIWVCLFDWGFMLVSQPHPSYDAATSAVVWGWLLRDGMPMLCLFHLATASAFGHVAALPK